VAVDEVFTTEVDNAFRELNQVTSTSARNAHATTAAGVVELMARGGVLENRITSSASR
jgi:hypothetical protein